MSYLAKQKQNNTARRLRQLADLHGFGDRPGLDSEVAAFSQWCCENIHRRGPAINVWLTGATVKEAIEISAMSTHSTYVSEREKGASHNEALQIARDTHICQWTYTVDDRRCPVLRTGTVHTIRRCNSCGKQEASYRTHNYSGD